MFRIENIRLLQEKVLVDEKCESINLIVGENNAGKTTLLTEIYNEVKVLSARPPYHNWTFGMKLVIENAENEITRVFPKLSNGGTFQGFDTINDNIYISKEQRKEGINWNTNVVEFLNQSRNSKLEYEFKYGNLESDIDLHNFFSFLTNTFIKGESCVERLNSNFNTVINNINITPENDFVFHLYKNKKLFSIIQKSVKEMYGYDIEFDNIPQGEKPIRIIKAKINKRITDHSLLNKEWDSKTELLDSVGHGIRSYLKLLFSLYDSTNQIVLIDEPEMFIHPPQRRALGKLIAAISIKEKKQVFIATHDSEFIRGVISSSIEKVKIFRLINEKGKHSYLTTNGLEINSILTKKASGLLNERILNSFFYKKTVLCENENDRVFYEEGTALYHWKKFHDINFVGLNGHGIVIKMYNKLRELRIKAIGLVDFDYLRDGHFPISIEDTNLKSQFESVQGKLKQLVPDKGAEYNLFKKKGIRYFRKAIYRSLYAEINSLITNLRKQDIFIVPNGELESWADSEKNDLTHLINTIKKKKIQSLAKFLEKIAQ